MKKFFATLTAASLIFGTASAMKPVTLIEQGSFFAGGKVITSAGVYNGVNDPTDFSGNTLHGDQAYVFYQIPAKAKSHALIFLHGYGQSGKSWESTPDGRDGFQNIFLERSYKIFIVDEPRRGRAGRATVDATIPAHPDDQLWYNNFRIGQ